MFHPEESKLLSIYNCLENSTIFRKDAADVLPTLPWVKLTLFAIRRYLWTLLNASGFIYQLQKSYLVGLPYILFYMQNRAAYPINQFYYYGNIYSCKTGKSLYCSPSPVLQSAAKQYTLKLQILRGKNKYFFSLFWLLCFLFFFLIPSKLHSKWRTL